MHTMTETHERTSVESSCGVAVDVAHVSKNYGAVTALNDLSVRIAPGERVVILGPSGSGKSTLLRHINGLERATAGRITVLGSSVDPLRGSALRRFRSHIGFIFQQFELVGSATALENVLMGGLSRLRGPRVGALSYPKPFRDRARQLLDEVGLADHANRRADTLSGGQQQRTAIARALMQEPDILLADEPVASLDPETSRGVLALLGNLARQRQITVLCNLHQVDLALGWADRIIALRDGALILDQTVDQIDRNELMGIYTHGAHAGHKAMNTHAPIVEYREQAT